jgi:small multidrug resistance pump
MAWLVLTIAILVEVMGTTLMKLSQGLTILWPSISVFVCYGISLTGITVVLKHIELSIAYAIWSGVGTALTAIIGTGWFREPVSALRLVSLVLVVAGVIGLQLSSTSR